MRNSLVSVTVGWTNEEIADCGASLIGIRFYGCGKEPKKRVTVMNVHGEQNTFLLSNKLKKEN